MRYEAIYADGQVVQRGDSLVGADGQLYDFVTALTKTVVKVRGMEYKEINPGWFGIRVREKQT